jgi:uncharacterized protein (DUF2235 family)
MNERQYKRLVVCCDGTWNLPDQRSPTNVTKVALAVAEQDRHGIEQRVFYHHGVGTHRWDRLRGGAFGAGLSRDVCDAYRFIVKNYEPGDELFFFGFSRGAFTARSTVGLVRNAGIIRPENIDLVDEAYALYRSRAETKKPRGREAVLFRQAYSHETRIRFIGVWDTVGKLGIPVGPTRLIGPINKRFEFHDAELSTDVDAAYQALAIDEKRLPFEPAVWKVRTDAPSHQQVEQVWFSGVHCDVGGGNPDHRLSDCALLWMVDRAISCGLAFREGAFVHQPDPPGAPDGGGAPRTESVAEMRRRCTRVMPDPFAQIKDSRRWFYRWLPALNRKPEFAGASGQSLSPTAVQRHLNDPSYAPVNFADRLDDCLDDCLDDEQGGSTGPGVTQVR